MKTFTFRIANRNVSVEAENCTEAQVALRADGYSVQAVANSFLIEVSND